MADATPTDPPKSDPAADKAAAMAVLAADSERRRARCVELIEAAQRETGCELVTSVHSWIENGVVRVAPRTDVIDRGSPRG